MKSLSLSLSFRSESGRNNKSMIHSCRDGSAREAWLTGALDISSNILSAREELIP